MGREWISLHSSIGVRIPQLGRKDTSRIPDICVGSKAQWQGLLDKSAVLEDSPPFLVMEVVSEETQIIDHCRKRAEYNPKSSRKGYESNFALIHAAVFGFVKEQTQRGWSEHTREAEYQEAVKIARQFFLRLQEQLQWRPKR